MLLFLCLLAPIRAIPIDNGVIGHPDVSCGPHSIRLDVKTKNPFKGRVYVKGEAEVKGCTTTSHETPNLVPSNEQYPVQPVQSGPYNGKAKTSKTKRSTAYGQQESSYGGHGAFFELPLGHCNMRRARTLYPRGVEYTYVAVVSFHPLFITKVDKAYRIRCFYMEGEKLVTNNLDVSMLTTAGLEQQYPMPVCSYHIKRDGYSGGEIRYAKVGDPITHIWQCTPQDAHYQYDMLVKNCYVDNGRGKRFQLIDAKGCPVDKHLIPEISYNAKALKASVKAHVFKFADIPQLYFTCTIQLCVKTDGGCEGITPPQCGYGPPAIQTYGPQPVAYSKPKQSYGPPPQTYGKPQPTYGPPLPASQGYRAGNRKPPPGYIGPPNMPHYQNIGGAAVRPGYGPSYNLDDAEGKRVYDAPDEAEPTKPSGDVVVIMEGPTPTVVKTEKQKRALTTADSEKQQNPLGFLETEISSQPLLILPFEDEMLMGDDNRSQRLTIVDPLIEARDPSQDMCLTASGFSAVVCMFGLLCVFSLILTVYVVRNYVKNKTMM